MLISNLSPFSETQDTNVTKLTAHEALSGIFAAISLSSWVFFLLPQLLENRRNQSGEAVSLSFVLIRFAGDIFSLLGGIFAQIIPGMIAVTTEFCVSDVLLISQILYYGIRNRRKEGKGVLAATIETFRGNLEPVDNKPVGSESGEPSETSSLLNHRTHETTFRSSGSPKCCHSAEGPVDRLTEVLDESAPQSATRLWLKNLGFILAVIVIAIVGWALAFWSGTWKPQPEERTASAHEAKDTGAKGGQVLGYISAALLLGCRIPQIWRNWRYKSCEGLSLLFFILSLIGNLSQGASILFHSTQRAYMIKNISWLVGSLGTVAQDVIIFIQFRLYRKSS